MKIQTYSLNTNTNTSKQYKYKCILKMNGGCWIADGGDDMNQDVFENKSHRRWISTDGGKSKKCTSHAREGKARRLL